MLLQRKPSDTIKLPEWYSDTLPKFVKTKKRKHKYSSSKLRNIINSFSNKLYPSWYNKIPYPKRVDYVHGVNKLNVEETGQILWAKHLSYMKKKLNINYAGKTYILKKGTILFHTASDILPFHKDDFLSKYPYPAYFFGLSSIIAIWYAVEKYTEFKQYQENTKLFNWMNPNHSLEKPPYYLNIYKLSEDLVFRYIDDDISTNQEWPQHRDCRTKYPCLHPQYAYHSIEQMYTGRGPVELDFELTIPIRILKNGWTFSRGSKSNPFRQPPRYQLPPVIPIAVYEIDVDLLLKNSYVNINNFNPIDAIDLNNPVWIK